MEKRVSVIITIYNAGAYLERSLNSALAQDYPNIEIILIDDGSFDASPDICMRYLEKYDNIRYFRQNNQNVGISRQFGISKSTGDYICFLDADDYMDENYVSQMIGVANEKDADLVCCGFYDVYVNRKITERLSFAGIAEKKDFVVALFDNPNIGSYLWNKLIKRELYIENSIPDYCAFEDLATVYKIALKANVIAGVEDALYYYMHDNPNSLTKKWSGEKSGIFFDVYQKAKNDICESYPDLGDEFEKICVLAAMKDCKALYKNKKSNRLIRERIRMNWEYIDAHKCLLNKKELLEAKLICEAPWVARSMLLVKSYYFSK